MDARQVVYAGRDYKRAEVAFISGECAILMDSTSTIGVLKNDAKFNWAAAPLPVEASNKTPRNSIIGGASLWVLKGHPQKDDQGVADYLLPQHPVGEFSLIRFVMNDELKMLWQGKKTAKQALDDAASAGNEILRRFEAASR